MHWSRKFREAGGMFWYSSIHPGSMFFTASGLAGSAASSRCGIWSLVQTSESTMKSIRKSLACFFSKGSFTDAVSVDSVAGFLRGRNWFFLPSWCDCRWMTDEKSAWLGTQEVCLWPTESFPSVLWPRHSIHFCISLWKSRHHGKRRSRLFILCLNSVFL